MNTRNHSMTDSPLLESLLLTSPPLLLRIDLPQLPGGQNLLHLITVHHLPSDFLTRVATQTHGPGIQLGDNRTPTLGLIGGKIHLKATVVGPDLGLRTLWRNQCLSLRSHGEVLSLKTKTLQIGKQYHFSIIYCFLIFVSFGRGSSFLRPSQPQSRDTRDFPLDRRPHDGYPSVFPPEADFDAPYPLRQHPDPYPLRDSRYDSYRPPYDERDSWASQYPVHNGPPEVSNFSRDHRVPSYPRSDYDDYGEHFADRDRYLPASSPTRRTFSGAAPTRDFHPEFYHNHGRPRSISGPQRITYGNTFRPRSPRAKKRPPSNDSRSSFDSRSSRGARRSRHPSEQREESLASTPRADRDGSSHPQSPISHGPDKVEKSTSNGVLAHPPKDASSQPGAFHYQSKFSL